MLMDLADAVAAIHPTDSLAVPLGPGVPGGFLHALGAGRVGAKWLISRPFPAAPDPRLPRDNLTRRRN